MPREGTETLFEYTLKSLCSPFGNKMPREGTETQERHMNPILYKFGNKMPREGTETESKTLINIKLINRFGNKMPREGTETFHNLS